MTTTISGLRQDLFKIIDNSIRYNECINVTTKNGNAVIISEEEYNGLIATAQIMENKPLYEKILKGMKEDLEQCVAEKEVKF